jgi:hypothetical protein
MTKEFDPSAPRSDFPESGYPTCRVFNSLTGERYELGLPEENKILRGYIPALAPVMAMQAANETAAYVVQLFLPHACSGNSAQDIADFALESFKTSFDAAQREVLVALEFGVSTGGTTRYLGQKLQKTNLYGFDWFHGLTEDWTDFQKKDRWTQNGKLPENLPPNVQIVEGKFQDTLKGFLEQHDGMEVGFVHMDADTYESTKYALDLVIPKMPDGAIILFDDYFNFPGWSKPGLGEASAWHDIVKQFRLTVEPVCFALEHQSTAWKICSNPFHKGAEKDNYGKNYTKLPPIEHYMTFNSLARPVL